MGKRMKIWFHSSSTSDIKEFTVSKFTILSVCLLFIVSAIGIAFMGYDYVRLKTRSLDIARLNESVLTKEIEIQNQRSQIQFFANEIEALKSQVGNLAKFEDKVRLIADIKQTSDSSGLIGIGGLPKESLDPDIPLEQKHNALVREMHEQTAQTEQVAKKEILGFEQLIKRLEEKKNILASTPSIKPVDGWITSKFGRRVSPFTGRKEFHSGLDIANKPGNKIVATADGRATFAGRKMYIGNMIILDHGYGRITKYGHLQKVLISKGQKVKRGDVIGLLGNTGRSTGPHLHYEVQVNGAPVDPMKYILN